MQRSPGTRRLAQTLLAAPLLVLLALAPVAWATPVLAVSYGTPAPTATPATTPLPSAIQLGAGTSATLGSYLTGADGLTLYTLSTDSTGASPCTGGCLVNWPPLLVATGGSASGPATATGSFGTFVRAAGTTQVTYDGRPLYYFKADTAAGQANGQGIKALGGVWVVAALSGASASVKLGIGTSASLGSYLTGPSGLTLYTLSSDPANGAVCNGACLANWPPLLIAPGGSVSAATGTGGTFGSFVRADGTVQVTHDSHPLYYFKADTAAGQANGQGIQALGGTWHVALASTGPAASASPAPGGSARPTGASLPPTDTAGGGPGGPGGLLPLLALIVGAGLVAMGITRALTPRRRPTRR